jgi:hypothetical protein
MRVRYAAGLSRASFSAAGARSSADLASAALRFVWFVAVLVSALAVGCAPRIGDGCYTQTNCSINGDRVCDVTQPGGYCTVFDCSPDTCPDDAVCVRFEPDTPRLSRNVCMRRCSSSGDCRQDKGYSCVGNTNGTIFGDAGPSAPDGGMPVVLRHDYVVADINRPYGTFCIAPAH